MSTPKLTNEVITAAIEGFETQKTRIDAQIADLRALLNGTTQPSAASAEPKGKRRKMSAAARKRIGDAQRKRWAESKGESESPAKAVTTKPKRRLSAAGRANIIAALKKRWKEKKAAATKAAPVAAKKSTAKKASMKTAAKKSAKSAPE